MKKFIISMLGEDRPGIIAATTRVLFEKQFNIEDVSQTILQSQFSGIFIVSGPDEIAADRLTAELTAATSAYGMHYYIKEIAAEPFQWTACACEPFIITTRGPDSKGLVAQITAVLATYNVNITQLRAVFRGDREPQNNVMVYEVDVPLDTDQQRLRADLRAKAAQLNLDINVQHKNMFEAINRI
jgi:glycine cleavage system transcriptional repressor